jgi:fructose-bisphosphate aldolase class I
VKYEDQLKTNAKAMVAAGKGLLAADESAATAEKRLTAVGLESTEVVRRE